MDTNDSVFVRSHYRGNVYFRVHWSEGIVSALTDILHKFADHLGASSLHEDIDKLDTDKVPDKTVEKDSEESNAQQ